MPIKISKPGPGTIKQVSDIVAAYVSNNAVPTAELPHLIAAVYAAVLGLGSTNRTQVPGATAVRLSPSQIRGSVQHDGITSFIDGRSYQTLKRHLTAHGLHPASYRARYGLPDDYPMVAPSYSKKRSELAKAIGLGQTGAMATRGTKDRRPL